VRRSFRFALALVVGLGIVTVAAVLLFERTSRTWFERDVSLRADGAVGGARRSLVAHWQEPPALAEVLGDITHDPRIFAAAACTTDGEPLVKTADFPSTFTCQRIAVLATEPGGGLTRWRTRYTLGDASVHVSAIPVVDDQRTLGFVVIAQDLSFIEAREGWARWFLLGGFAIFAVAAAAVTILSASLARREGLRELRGLLAGHAKTDDFAPPAADVRDLLGEIVAERESGVEQGAWNPERLRQTLSRYFVGEKVVILSNREPYIHSHDSDGKIRVVHPASGLVTALEPVMRACSGVWIAHGSGNADRETADRHGRVRVPPGDEAYVLRRVWLDAAEEQGYYYGFSNEGMWPLCHLAHTRPAFRTEDWHHYREVNQRFADAIVEEVDREDPVILVQDYHFALVPQLVRERMPRATIIMFWHIPWPSAERFGICPWAEEILNGMLGASIIGFHTQWNCNNFVDSVDRVLEARIDRERHAVVQRGRSTLVRPYPISVEWPSRWIDGMPPSSECRKEILAELGLAPDALLGVGVDRLDYTKGIEERLCAVERLLERHAAYRGRFTFVQLAAPSRGVIPRYRELDAGVEALAARINDRFGDGSYQPIILLRAHHEPPTVFRFYRAADVCYVSSLHDGMNLVAKEFVAARDDERGVLVLSQFTGAARELTEALIVNPYDFDEAAAALATALEMSASEQRERIRAMRAYVAEFNVYRWAGRMLVDAARLRQRDRITGRLPIRLATQGSNA
jgi:trehalose 6-phosphate synthase